ncbi:hypothetical protein [Salipaludibacillus aurantiacus]|uniref:CobQ/CobB/MinD/ParA nucleotide binding domain-containing protein n=1 Tax=Salipaludibacillus aurantiacus TaxID=1601833 RepID=A0A1H9PB70_9BACI|nr:hypothetical protein [Salipaludibacillus aurantiacus]SER45417.1 hypothetical protein SAMN05518684_101227 [Salipaludibacillus aurantiacus]
MGKKCLIVTGHYGSGKTEFAIEKSIEIGSRLNRTFLCDLDIINPYFRSRDYKNILAEKGISLVAPENKLMKADLPIVTGEMTARLKDYSANLILDVGGDADGGAVLGQFSSLLQERGYDFLFVVNLNRPHVSSVEGILSAIRGVERSSRLKVTGLINNTHLGGERITAEDYMRGIDVCNEVGQALTIPLVYNMLEKKDYCSLKKNLLCESFNNVFVFKRKLVPPWQQWSKKEGTFNESNF